MPSATDTTAIAGELQEASRVFFPDLTTVEPIPGHPDVVKVATPAGFWRVRRWPESVSLDDVAISHEVMADAREAGLSVVPRIVAPPRAPDEPALRLGGRLYDAQQWMPGVTPPRAESAWPDVDDRIDIPATLSPAAFAQVIIATARLHESTAAIAKRRGVPTAQLAMLPGAVRQAHARHLGALRAGARREPAIQRWLATGERLMAAAEPIVLEATVERQLPASVLHLNLWPAHVLLDGDVLAGLLGWERVAVGSGLLDLAQATLRLQGWDDDAVESAIASYAAVRSLSPDERRLLPAVAALDAVATTGRLLEQTYTTSSAPRPPSALRAAIDMMLHSMTALDRNLAAQATVGKSRRTPWRRSGPSAPRREGGRPRERRR